MFSSCSFRAATSASTRSIFNDTTLIHATAAMTTASKTPKMTQTRQGLFMPHPLER